MPALVGPKGPQRFGGAETSVDTGRLDSVVMLSAGQRPCSAVNQVVIDGWAIDGWAIDGWAVIRPERCGDECFGDLALDKPGQTEN
jgi:hypothetical protein